MTVSPVRCVTAIAAVIAAGAPLEAQDARERFELFNECQPVGRTVDLNDGDGALPELTEERLWALAENRLRVARLFHGFTFNNLHLLMGGVLVPVLSIWVDVVGQAISGRVFLYKPVNDPSVVLPKSLAHGRSL